MPTNRVGPDTMNGDGEGIRHEAAPRFYRLCIFKSWERAFTGVRQRAYSIARHPRFEAFVLIMIVWSSVMLVFEDNRVDEPSRRYLRESLRVMNWIFAVAFLIEYVIKLLSFGWYGYFSVGWNILDFCIVVVAWALLIMEGMDSVASVVALRSLRALRPLRAIRRLDGMRVVVNSLLASIPNIGNVVIVGLLFWLIFSIMGVQFYGSQFGRCTYRNPTRDIVPWTIVADKNDCCNATVYGSTSACNGDPDHVYYWDEPKVNFDNALNGFFALFQVASFEGWMEVMQAAVDSVGVDMQPKRENRFEAYFFFVTFIIVGAFFVINLFVGVIIDKFNELKKKYEIDGVTGGLFVTDKQMTYVQTIGSMLRAKPIERIKEPSNSIRKRCFKIVMAPKFEGLVMTLIILNTIVFCTKHYGEPTWWGPGPSGLGIANASFWMNATFTFLFVIEAAVKILGLGRNYFKEGWNIFDFVITLSSLAGVIVDLMVAFAGAGAGSSSLLGAIVIARVFRVLRILRLLRTIKYATGIRRLLTTLVISAPALLNIGMLLALVMCIYALIGMNLFKHVRHQRSLDDFVNFETFPRSFLALFRLSTSAGWNDVADALSIEGKSECNSTHYHSEHLEVWVEKANGDCGNKLAAQLLLLTYVVISFMIIVNMYIAVILDNLHRIIKDEDENTQATLHTVHFESFYAAWQLFDPKATQFIRLSELKGFLCQIPPPLGYYPDGCSDFDIGELAIPLFIDDDATGQMDSNPKVHCADVLDILVQNALGVHSRKHGKNAISHPELREIMNRKLAERFPSQVKTGVAASDTYEYWRATQAVKRIQRAWRKLVYSRPMDTIILVRSDGVDPEK